MWAEWNPSPCPFAFTPDSSSLKETLFTECMFSPRLPAGTPLEPFTAVPSPYQKVAGNSLRTAASQTGAFYLDSKTGSQNRHEVCRCEYEQVERVWRLLTVKTRSSQSEIHRHLEVRTHTTLHIPLLTRSFHFVRKLDGFESSLLKIYMQLLPPQKF